MCGINGLVNRHHSPPDFQAHVLRMNTAIAHRGPDDQGIWADARMTLGHRRLSIIDLSERGRQPIASADGALVLVCNGEIYNYSELRIRFAAEGYRFRSDTDVEVILPLYERYGARCVEHLTGMFAFALWDSRNGRLLLARDRVGEKPLYVAMADDWLAFSSEAKGLLALPFVDRRLNEEAVPLLMAHQSLPAPVTMYQGIEMLPPATIMTWENGRVRRERYWRLDFSRRSAFNASEALSTYEDVLGASVKGCLAADVPVALMLSGGVDSSTIAALAVKHHSSISSFCLGQDNKDQPDIEWARAAQVAQVLCTNHDNIGYDVDFGRLPNIIAQYGQPIWSLVTLYADHLSECMRRQAKVVLTGNGADEAFGGYKAYAALPWRQWAGSMAAMLPSPLLRSVPSERFQRLAGMFKGPFWASRGASMTAHTRTLMQTLCTPAFNKRWTEYEAGRFANAAAEECNPQSLFDAVRYSDLMVCHQHGHCLIPDISGMSHGLELRSPFLNHHVLELAAATPQRFLLPWPYRGSQTKWVTKQWLERILPRDIVHARKVGFGYGVSFSEHLTGAKSAPVREKLLSGSYLGLGIFTRQGAEWALENSLSATVMLLCFAIWADQHLAGSISAEVPQQSP